MTQDKLLKLAAHFLGELSGRYGNDGCNDFDPPEGFTSDDIESLFPSEPELSGYNWAVVDAVEKKLTNLAAKVERLEDAIRSAREAIDRHYGGVSLCTLSQIDDILAAAEGRHP